MKNFHIFLDPTGTWKGNEFPDEPGRFFTYYSAGGKTAETAQEAGRIYQIAVKKLKSEALEAKDVPAEQINPDDPTRWLLYLVEDDPIEVVPGVLYPWDGGWKIYEDMQEDIGGIYKIRLLPKSPVTLGACIICGAIEGEPHYATCSKATTAAPPTPLIPERSIASPDHLPSLNTGIVATGEPEFNVRDNAIVVSGTVSGKSSSEILDEFSTLRGATGREEPQEERSLNYGSQSMQTSLSISV